MIVTVGGVVSAGVYVTASVFVPPGLFAASCAVIVMLFKPLAREIPEQLQLVVPMHVPLPPVLFDHVTWVTPTLSDAVPLIVSGVLAVFHDVPDVGDMIVAIGGVVSAGVKFAVTVLSALNVTTHVVPVMVSHPVQELKLLLPDKDGAVNVTDVPS